MELLDQLREALIYKFGGQQLFAKNLQALKTTPIDIVKQPDNEGFFSIQTRDNADLFEGVEEWGNSASIEVHEDKLEYYYNGSIVMAINSSMHETYEKLTLELVVNFFRVNDRMYKTPAKQENKTISFKACKHLNYSDCYDSRRELIDVDSDTKVCHIRNRNGDLVQFCKLRGRLNSPKSCLCESSKMCDYYEESVHNVDIDR